MAKRVKILDGGMGRELKRMGVPFEQPEWSALALMQAPHLVELAHDAFVQSGAEIITTNSYAVVPFHIGRERFAERGQALAQLSAELARASAAKAAHPVLVAGSLPPALGSYRPDWFDYRESVQIHQTLIAGMAPWVDIWLAETQSSIAEVRAAYDALAAMPQPITPKPLWVSFTLDDAPPDQQALLRSGETVADAVNAALALDVAAVLFNCSQPEVMSNAIVQTRAILDAAHSTAELGVYANAFPPQTKDAQANDTLCDIRTDLDPLSYLRWARTWVEQGASVVGGCCGIAPAHIQELAKAFHG